MKKLVFIMDYDLSPRYLNQFALDGLSESFDLEYWDCGNIVEQNTITKSPIQREYVKHISSVDLFKQNIKKLPKDSIIMNGLGPFGGNSHLQIIIARYFPTVTFIYYNKYYKEEIEPCLLRKNNENIILKKDNSNQKSLFSRIKRFIYRNDYVYYLAKYIRYGGDSRYKECVKQRQNQKISLMNWLFIGNTKGYNEYPIPHPDIEIVKRSIANLEETQKPFILFIDANWPLKPSWGVKNVDKISLAKTYNASLNDFFDYVERIYGCEVIVAAHPTANYNEAIFNNRKIYYGKTIELVQKCKYILIHESELMNVIAYYDKPIAFINNEMIDSIMNKDCSLPLSDLIRQQAEKFKFKVIYTDNYEKNKDAEIFKMIDPIIREEYVREFLGNVSDSRTLAEIYKSHFNNIYNRLYGNVKLVRYAT